MNESVNQFLVFRHTISESVNNQFSVFRRTIKSLSTNETTFTKKLHKNLHRSAGFDMSGWLCNSFSAALKTDGSGDSVILLSSVYTAQINFVDNLLSICCYINVISVKSLSNV